MMQIQSKQPSRQGFTLIELLVVIAIIAILMGLTLAAVMKYLIKGPEALTRADISGMTSAIGGWQGQFGLKYNIPSQIVLREDGAYNMNNQLEKDSVTFLQQMFGKRLDLSPFNAGTGAGNDWNGNGTLDSGRIVLTGDQCLVFFLGGIPNQGTPAGCLGFSTSPTNPAQAGGNRIAPFFEFKSNRLVRGGNGFFSYQDGFGKNVYAYFSSYKLANGYNRYDGSGNIATPATAVSDCASLPGSPSPYVLATTPTTVYINASSFQIISAGANGNFGAGCPPPSFASTWTPSAGYPPSDPGADDFSNFSSLRLGAPQQ